MTKQSSICLVVKGGTVYTAKKNRDGLWVDFRECRLYGPRAMGEACRLFIEIVPQKGVQYPSRRLFITDDQVSDLCLVEGTPRLGFKSWAVNPVDPVEWAWLSEGSDLTWLDDQPLTGKLEKPPTLFQTVSATSPESLEAFEAYKRAQKAAVAEWDRKRAAQMALHEELAEKFEQSIWGLLSKQEQKWLVRFVRNGRASHEVQEALSSKDKEGFYWWRERAGKGKISGWHPVSAKKLIPEPLLKKLIPEAE